MKESLLDLFYQDLLKHHETEALAIAELVMNMRINGAMRDRKSVV